MARGLEPPRTRRRKAADLEGLRVALSCLLANLVAARRNKVRPEAFVAMSFDDARFVRSDVSITPLRTARDVLASLDLVEGQRGYQRLISGGGFEYQAHARTTRLRATGALAAWFGEAGLDDTARAGTPASGIGWEPSWTPSWTPWRRTRR